MSYDGMEWMKMAKNLNLHFLSGYFHLFACRGWGFFTNGAFMYVDVCHEVLLSLSVFFSAGGWGSKRASMGF